MHGRLKLKMKLTNKRADLIITPLLGIGIWLLLYCFMGFYKIGLDAPCAYAGGDDFTFLANIKSIGDNGWFWKNSYLAAPFEAEQYGYPLFFGMNFECIITRFLYLFSDDAIVVRNIQFLCMFAMAAMMAYVVMRSLEVERGISVFSSILFGLAPYIFGRNVGHFNLSACYFVPLSILLCIWTFEEDEKYLHFDKTFFKNKKNVLTLIFTILIANNGTVYYAFFTCFFLCVVALYKAVLQKNIKVTVPAVKTCACIFFFLLIAFIPVFLDLLKGGTLSVERGYEGGEIYGLKIIQMFVPLNDHGIGLLNRIISKYNEIMPLVNENRYAYLGVGAAVGFLIALFHLLLPSPVYLSNPTSKEQKENVRIHLLSKLIIFAILLATIGGFSSLLGIALPMIRSYNRISIFIMFMCLYILAACLLKIKRRCVLSSKSVRVGVLCCCVLFCGFCLWEQLPTWGMNDEVLRQNKDLYEMDARFVSDIEEELQDGDGVYQLPYHGFPEEGPVNNMSDYALFTGYIHSKTLKWSYGSIKDTEEDLWNRNTASLPVDEMIDEIVEKGFKGIYIDKRAYDEESIALLMSSIETVLGETPYVSESGDLIFYNLYPYMERKSAAF